MKQYSLNLDKQYQRPVVLLSNGLTALLDTGAYIPVWTDEEDILISDMGAELVKEKVPLSGFGGATYGNLYKVSITVGGIIYPDMHIIANNDIDAAFNLILSATMFDGLIYQIDTVNHILNVDVPDNESNIRNLSVDVPDNESNIRNLRIESRDGRQFVLCGGKMIK